LRRLGLPLARADLLLERVLRFLRGGAPALGALARQGSEPRRDPDERRADDRLLRRALLLPHAPALRGGRGAAGARGPMRRALLLAVAFALVAVPAASANGDPASDVLLTEKVFVGPEVPVSKSKLDALNKTVEAANAKGYPIRVAVIAFTGDLGTAVSLWGKPQDYSRFLGSEIAFVYPKRLLVAMPAGFGVYKQHESTDTEQQALEGLKAGKTPDALVQSTTRAVRKLAASGGVQVPDYSSGGGGHDWRDRIVIAVGGLLVVAL